MTAVHVHHAKIFTGDRGRPWASSMTIADDRITALDGPPPPGHRTHDMRGRTIVPGFVDAHNHHALAGIEQLYEFGVSPEAGLDELLATVGSRTGAAEGVGWSIGNGWSPLLFGALGSADALARLDAVTGDRPTIVRDQSRHNRWANSAALAAVGITEPTSGLLVEAEGLGVEIAAARQVEDAELRWAKASRHAIGLLHGYGVTAFQDAAASLPLLRALKALDDRDQLPAWVVTCMLINDQLFGFDPLGWELIDKGRATAGRRHRPTFAKLFLDGIPPMHTAAFLDPYGPVEPAARGEMTMSRQALTTWLLELAAEGLSAKIHCTGDASVRAALDAIAVVREAQYLDVGFHIAHGQYVHPDDLPRFAELDVVAEISPFVWYPGVIPEALAGVLGADRAGNIHPNKDLLGQGALLAAGSDWPVSETPDPLQGIFGLVTRADPTGRFGGRLWPEQALSVTQAVEVFTANGARAIGLDEVCGRLTPGRSADFAVLDTDLFDCSERELARAKVLETWFAGTPVYQA